MSAPGTTASAQRRKAPFVRRAAPADHVTIRAIVTAAYGQYASLIPPVMFSRYLADLLDLDKHASHGPLLVVEADGQVRGFAAFYPQASSQRLGWPAGWASGRALAVDPATRGHGIARAMAAACERLAHDSGSPVLAFHTASFMTSAIALYERLGYQRAPEFDFDMAVHYGSSSAVPITALAYLRYLRRMPAHV
jgi:ribosomal protein S18 acetylase RimI-like enzyme